MISKVIVLFVFPSSLFPLVADESLCISFRSIFYMSQAILAYFASPEGLNLHSRGRSPRYAYTHIFASPEGLNKIHFVRNCMKFNPYGVDDCCTIQPRTSSVATHIQALRACRRFIFKPSPFCAKRLAIRDRRLSPK